MEERAYKIPDPDMFASGRTMRALFLDHKAAFVAEDALVDLPFETDWLTSIEASEAWESDESRTDQQKQETDDVEEKMVKGRKKWTQMKYFVDQAFEGKPNTQNKFGENDYSEAANNQARMVSFLTKLHTESEVPAQKAALIAKGCTQLIIDDIATVRNELAAENTEQDRFIGESPEATMARIKQYNSTYSFPQKINRLSKVVYFGDTVMLNMFKLPAGAQPDPDINVKGKVTDTANGNPLKGVTVELDTPSGVKDITAFYGLYDFVTIPAGSHTLTFTRVGYTPQTKNITVLATGVVVMDVQMTVL